MADLIVPTKAFWWPEQSFPPVDDQCRTEACVGWATGYYTKSFFVERRRQAVAAPDVRAAGPDGWVSPSWVHNLLADGYDEGQTPALGAAVLSVHGAASVAEMPITCDPGVGPTDRARADVAARLEAAGTSSERDRLPRHFTRALPSGTRAADLDAAIDYLAREGPLVFWVEVDGAFFAPAPATGSGHGRDEYEPGDAPVDDPDALATHALTCVGYDPARPRRGAPPSPAFRFVNSAGADWRQDGFVWIRREILEPMLLGVVAVEEAPDRLASMDPKDRIDVKSLAAGVVMAKEPKPARAVQVHREPSECRKKQYAWEGCAALQRIKGFPIRMRGRRNVTLFGPGYPPERISGDTDVVARVGAHSTWEKKRQELETLVNQTKSKETRWVYGRTRVYTKFVIPAAIAELAVEDKAPTIELVIVRKGLDVYKRRYVILTSVDA